MKQIDFTKVMLNVKAYNKENCVFPFKARFLLHLGVATFYLSAAFSSVVQTIAVYADCASTPVVFHQYAGLRIYRRKSGNVVVF